MAHEDKIIKKMKNQPHGVRMDEADKVLTLYGYRLDRQRSSHRQYINKNGDVITIKESNPLKKAYINAILERIGEK
ncbi:MAG: type II toxin-antitoxin system HicA family toxin [Treponema sp.]|jgi:predicted RNA binding protein YcfA (HicA-like mRNA interferase family)|nr:type II toxin-antitoxin system HicA family toxin [Treponema sp.]